MASKKQIIFPIAIITLGIVSAFALSAMKEEPIKEAKIAKPLSVKAKTLDPQNMTLSVKSYGLVAPKYSTALVAQVSGQIIGISEKFVKGGFIKQGETLARIDPNDYEAALIEAQASLAQASSALEIERAQAHVAKAEWQRIKSADTSTIPSELYLRKPQLADKLAQFKAAQAAVKRAKRNLERTYIKAPYDAIVSKRDISMGSVANVGASIGMLNSISEAEIRLPIAGKDLKHLENNGLDATVTFTSDITGQPVTWSGKIVRSEGVIDNQSRMTHLVAEVSQPYGDPKQPLHFGTYLNAKIEGKTIENAISIPQHLVKNQRVAMVNERSELTFQSIDIVRESNGFVITQSPVEARNKLILSAIEFPVEGMKLDSEVTQNNETTQLALKKD